MAPTGRHQWIPLGVTRYKLVGRRGSSSEPPGFLIKHHAGGFGTAASGARGVQHLGAQSLHSRFKRKGLIRAATWSTAILKYAMPLACPIMAALGISLSLDPLPRHLSLGAASDSRSDRFGYWLAAWPDHLARAFGIHARMVRGVVAESPVHNACRRHLSLRRRALTPDSQRSIDSGGARRFN